MERRKAITTAAAAGLTLLAGTGGIALNSGLVGASSHRDVGQLSPVTLVEDPAATQVSVPPVQATESAPVTTSSASGYDDDHSHEDDDEHEVYEGRSDDD